MDMYVIARLKSSYEKWEEIFSSDPLLRSNFCEASRTTTGKIGKKAALIALFDVDKDKLINAPFDTPVGRLDETKANRKLNLKWKKGEL